MPRTNATRREQEQDSTSYSFLLKCLAVFATVAAVAASSITIATTATAVKSAAIASAALSSKAFIATAAMSGAAAMGSFAPPLLLLATTIILAVAAAYLVNKCLSSSTPVARTHVGFHSPLGYHFYPLAGPLTYAAYHRPEHGHPSDHGHHRPPHPGFFGAPSKQHGHGPTIAVRDSTPPMYQRPGVKSS